MSLESHVKSLELKHAALDKQIEQEQRRPGADPVDVSQLKKRKLKLKDEIERARHQAA